jgi:methylglyoxal synthase
MKDQREKPILGFSAAELFRNEGSEDFERFLCQYLFSLCSSMELIATGGTVRFIAQLLEKPLRDDVFFSSHHNVETSAHFEEWKAKIRRSVTDVGGGTRGMVAITNGVVEGTVSAILHFTDRVDVERSSYTQALSRQAIVHDVPIANDLETAAAMATAWLPLFSGDKTPFKTRKVESLMARLNGANRALCLIAHDQKKLELCDFVVRYAPKIIERYDALIATGTTGKWIKRFLISTGHKDIAEKVVCCNSGPEGGDVQIANVVCEGKCKDVIFFQDPATSHPHNSDIRLFEQAIYAKVTTAHLARNWATAELVIGA